MRLKCLKKDLKKNDEVKTTQLGPPVSGKLLESPLQGRGLKRTILIYSNGTEVNLSNDHGSVYAHEVAQVKRDGTWQQVTDQPRTHATQKFIDAIKL